MFQNIEQNVRSTKNKWITDFVMMPHYTKVIVGTGLVLSSFLHALYYCLPIGM